MKKCVATNHAYDRAKERMSWNKKTLDNLITLHRDPRIIEIMKEEGLKWKELGIKTNPALQ